MTYNFRGSSGNLVLLSSQTASNSATLPFITGITGFDAYYFLYYGVTVASTSTIWLQLSTNGGSSYNTTTYDCWNVVSYNGGIVQGLAGATSGLVIVNGGEASATIPSSGHAQLFNFHNTSFVKQCVSSCSTILGGANSTQSNASHWTTTTSVNAFQVIASVGNILTGTFKLYGIQN